MEIGVAVKSTGMGGGLSVCFGCNGCKESFTRYENEPACNNDISVSVQVAFILAGSTHTTYCKTLQNALGMKTVNANEKAMLDDLCEVAKREMKEKNDGDLGLWKRAVTAADGTWQTRGWHSKNATFTIRNESTKVRNSYAGTGCRHLHQATAYTTAIRYTCAYKFTTRVKSTA